MDWVANTEMVKQTATSIWNSRFGASHAARPAAPRTAATRRPAPDVRVSSAGGTLVSPRSVGSGMLGSWEPWSNEQCARAARPSRAQR